MKKLTFLIVSCALIIASCAKNESGIDESEGTPGTLVFKVSTDGANATRGGTIYGAEDTSAVAAVTVYAFNDAATSGVFLYDQTFTLSEWALKDKEGSYSVPNSTLGGNYKFLAVGTETSSPYTIATPEGSTDLETYAATLSDPLTAVPIFTGNTAKTLTAGKYALVPITIKRAVSGIMIYLQNIPMVAGESEDPTAYLRLTTETPINTSVVLSNGTGDDPEVVTDNILLEITLTGQTNDGTFWGGNDLSGTTPLVAKLPNTLYALGTKNLSTSLYGSDNTPDGEKTPTPGEGQEDDAAVDITNDQLIFVEVDGAWDISPLTLN